MRKSEMAEKQLHEQSTVVQILTKAGWEGTAFNQLFERDSPVNYEASMEYQNNTMNLTLSYEAEKHIIDLGIYENISGKGIDLIIHFEENLDNVLQAIISFQELISPNTYKEQVRHLLQICPSIYVNLGEEIVPLIDDQVDSIIEDE